MYLPHTPLHPLKNTDLDTSFIHSSFEGESAEVDKSKSNSISLKSQGSIGFVL